MISIERKKELIKILQIKGSINITEAADDLDVSSMTIRRDLADFASEGIVTLVHGGAVLNKGALFEYNTFLKQEEKFIEKFEIANYCISLINEGDSIYLDAGTTAKEIANLLLKKKNIVVITHSLLVANALIPNNNIRVIMCPGEFRKTSMAFMGSLTEEFISNFKIDILFLGVEGVDLKHGVTVPDIVDGTTKKKLVYSAEKVVCIVDNSKFNKSFLYRICPLNKIETIVTDSNIETYILNDYLSKNVNVVKSDKILNID